MSSLPPPPPPPPGAGEPATPATDPPPGWLDRDPSRPPTTAFPPSSRWGLGDVAVTVAIFFAVSIGIGIVAIIVNNDDDILTGPWLPAALAVPAIVQVAHVVWVARRKGNGLDADFGLAFAHRDIAIAVLIVAVGLVGAGVVASILAALGTEPPDAAVADLAEDSSSRAGGGPTLWIVVLAIMASTLIPVVEELVYRGMLWSALLKRGMNENVVLVLTAALFAVVHLEPVRSSILFVLGLAMGLGRRITGRIGAPIIAHALINGLSMTALLATL